MKNLSFYDNGGETYDRVTIVFNNTGRYEIGHNLKVYDAIGSSETGWGFFTHTTATKGRHLGKKVTFDQLHTDLQERIKNYLTE